MIGVGRRFRCTCSHPFKTETQPQASREIKDSARLEALTPSTVPHLGARAGDAPGDRVAVLEHSPLRSHVCSAHRQQADRGTWGLCPEG